MLLVTPVHSRRVLVLGAAGLVPAALVTLLLVHQPSIGDRRLYPLLRGSLTLVGLGLALAALITWATAPDRLSRSSLSGLAWAGVTTILCIGPFLESSPGARLYALDLKSGDLVWAKSRGWAGPVLDTEGLVVTDIEDRSFVWLDPTTGDERWRHGLDDADTQPQVGRAQAAGAYVPGSEDAETTPTVPILDVEGVDVVEEGLEGTGEGGARWSYPLRGEQVRALVRVDGSVYAYLSTPGAGGTAAGAIVKVDAADGSHGWRQALPEDIAAVAGGVPTIDANEDVVVVAGGEKFAVLEAGTGDLRWSESVVSLGKSRGYALPGADQRVELSPTMVYLSTTPES